MKFSEMTDSELAARIERVSARLDALHDSIRDAQDHRDRLAPAPAHIAAQRPHGRWIAADREERDALTARLRRLQNEWHRRGLGDEDDDYPPL